jgi:proteasome lid subunit RPN8/RPN11
MTMTWQPLEPDYKILPLSSFFHRFGWTRALPVCLQSVVSPQVLISIAARTTILEHVQTNHLEVGGLLVGSVYYLAYPVTTGHHFLVLIEEILPSNDVQNSEVALRMGVEVWDRARQRTESGLTILGWYHSHPGLGAFFSITDRETHRAFFPMPFSIGYVIDPIGEQETVCLSDRMIPLTGRVQEFDCGVE